jgi:hypothetical protein
MNNKWHGLMKILEIQQIRNNKVIWEEKNVNNTLHTLGERFFLKCCFENDPDASPRFPPQNYYLGLDNRSTVDVTDTISSLIDEPTNTNGYLRKPVSSLNGFSLELVNDIYRATSEIVSFNASGGGWGPVSKIFLTNTSTDTTETVLLATASLSSAITLSSGDAVNMRMALSLQDY